MSDNEQNQSPQVASMPIEWDEGKASYVSADKKFEYDPRIIPQGYEPHQIHYKDGFMDGAKWQFEELNSGREIKGLPLKVVSSYESRSVAMTGRNYGKSVVADALNSANRENELHITRIQQLEKEINSLQSRLDIKHKQIRDMTEENTELKATLKHDVDKIGAGYIQEINELKAKLEATKEDLSVNRECYYEVVEQRNALFSENTKLKTKLKALLDERNGR